MNDAEVAEFRNRTIGFVFQSHYLLPEFTALENVAMPALDPAAWSAAGRRCDARGSCWSGWGWARAWTTGRASCPAERRSGWRWRARWCSSPTLLLADEPTGNLDPATGEGIHQLLREVNRELGITAVVVTHNETLARSMPRRLRLAGGKVEPA